MTSAPDFNTRNIEQFRANHGRLGGPFEGAPVLLLHTVGAKSGLPRVNPMMYLAEGDRYLVFASKLGADCHPDWYHNLNAQPDVRIEIGDHTLNVHAEELHGVERDEKFALQAQRYPGFAEYQRKTERVIPVVALTATGETMPRPTRQIGGSSSTGTVTSTSCTSPRARCRAPGPGRSSSA